MKAPTATAAAANPVYRLEIKAPSHQQSPPEPAAATRAVPLARDTYRLGGNIVPPKVLHRVTPDFTQLGDYRIRGVRVVEAIVDVDGRVKDVRVVRGVNPKIDAPIVEAFKQWRFQPATLDGKPVNVYYTLTVKFDL